MKARGLLLEHGAGALIDGVGVVPKLKPLLDAVHRRRGRHGPWSPSPRRA